MKKKHPLLQTERLEIGYRAKAQNIRVAEGISFQLEAGELVAVIGINGVGKSTFLKTISGILQPLSGNVSLAGENLHQMKPRTLAGHISMVLTDSDYSKHLRVRELVSLGRYPHTNWMGALSSEDHQAVQTALELTATAGLAEKRCFELSDGQLQKVFIARALAQDTAIMILDEPTAHLDLYHKAQVLQQLQVLCKKTSRAIVFATHEINLALQLCDRIFLIHQQNSVLQRPQDLIDSGRLEQLFPEDLIIFDRTSGTFRIKT